MPTDKEWQTLVNYLGSFAGSKLAGRADLWNDDDLENNAAFDESGFSAFPAGYRSSNDGYFYSLGYYTYFWSSTEYSSGNAWARHLDYSGSEVTRYYSSNILNPDRVHVKSAMLINRPGHALHFNPVRVNIII